MSVANAPFPISHDETPARATTTPARSLPVTEQVDRIAHRIKTWRNAAGMSLQVLANRSDVSPSTIHKIENGQTVPTIAVLLKLAEGLGRRPTELLEDADGESGAIHTKAGTSAHLVTTRGLEIEWLIGEALAPELEIWRITHPESFSFGGERVKHLSGDVVLMVEEGELEVRIANDSFVLGAGDTIHFKGTQPHSWRNTSDGPTTALLLGNVQAGGRSGLVARMRRLRCTAKQNVGGTVPTPIAS
jgi:transcriptional regulator with XRE-family HTH domain